MKTLSVTILFFTILSCTNLERKGNVDFVFEGSRVKTKYTVMNWGNSSSNSFNYCDHEVKSYKQMNTYNCAFKLSGYQVNLREKFVLDKNGNLEEYWLYKSEGPLIYKAEDLKTDLKFLDQIGGKNLGIQLNKGTIIDSGEKYKIEKIYDSLNLILVVETFDHGKENRRILYEYE